MVVIVMMCVMFRCVYFLPFMILVAVKVTVIKCGGKIAEMVSTQLIHQRINDHRNIINLKSHETNKSVRLIMNNDIEILNSQRNRQTVDVWIWCRTQAALEHIHNLYQSNRMREVFFDEIQPSTSMVLKIERNQFKKNAGKFLFMNSLVTKKIYSK